MNGACHIIKCQTARHYISGKNGRFYRIIMIMVHLLLMCIEWKKNYYLLNFFLDNGLKKTTTTTFIFFLVGVSPPQGKQMSIFALISTTMLHTYILTIIYFQQELLMMTVISRAHLAVALLVFCKYVNFLQNMLTNMALMIINTSSTHGFW